MTSTIEDQLADLMTPGEVAALLGKRLWTLREWRARGVGPPWIETGVGAQPGVRDCRSRPRYSRRELERWLAELGWRRVETRTRGVGGWRGERE